MGSSGASREFIGFLQMRAAVFEAEALSKPFQSNTIRISWLLRTHDDAEIWLHAACVTCIECEIFRCYSSKLGTNSRTPESAPRMCGNPRVRNAVMPDPCTASLASRLVAETSSGESALRHGRAVAIFVSQVLVACNL